MVVIVKCLVILVHENCTNTRQQQYFIFISIITDLLLFVSFSDQIKSRQSFYDKRLIINLLKDMDARALFEY